MNKITVFFAHSPQDKEFVHELAEFLKLGAGIDVYADEGEIAPGETLIAKTQEGLTADVILVILSPDSVPSRWVRQEWESVFREQPGKAGVELACVLYRDCKFPELLRRRNFST